MNFKDAKNSIKLAILAGKVPTLVGERGIGKTELVKSVSTDLNMSFINIDCQLIKEGELGGQR